MKTVLKLLVAVSFTVLPMVECLSTGPPPSVCQSMLPQGHLNAGAEQINSDLYSLSVGQNTFSPGDSVVVNLVGANPYRGIFLQVRDGLDLDGTSATGMWDVPVGFRHIDCPTFPQGSALSHNSGSDKTPGSFVWFAPDSCTEGALYVVRATVVRRFTQIQTDITAFLTCSNPPTRAPAPVPQSSTAPETIAPPPSPLPPFIVPVLPVLTPLPPILPPSNTPPPVVSTESTLPPTALPFRPLSASVRCSFSDLDSIPTVYDNNFEDSSNILQGWEAIGQNYRWVRRTGPTPSLLTGPSSAYEGDYYVHTEASSPAQRGDQAILQTASNLRGCFCVRLGHSQLVRGTSHSITLEIGDNVVAVINQPTSEQWVPRAFQVDTPSFVRIRFVAERGLDWLGDIALDNIRITQGVC